MSTGVFKGLALLTPTFCSLGSLPEQFPSVLISKFCDTEYAQVTHLRQTAGLQVTS